MPKGEGGKARGDELAARIRAACAYADLSLDEAAVAFGLSKRQYGRYEAGDWKKDAPSREQLEAFADVCGVPRSFMRGGWGAIEELPSVAERVEAIEHRLETVAQRIEAALANGLPSELSEDQTRLWMDIGRAVTSVAVDQADAGDVSDPTAPGTRDTSGATQGSGSVPSQETPQVAGGLDQ